MLFYKYLKISAFILKKATIWKHLSVKPIVQSPQTVTKPGFNPEFSVLITNPPLHRPFVSSLNIFVVSDNCYTFVLYQ